MSSEHVTIMIKGSVNDMFGEFSYFLTEIFPELSQLCRNHNIEIDYVDYDAEQVCGVMELDSWDLKFFARCESYHSETAITVWYGSCDYIEIYENDTANVHWLGSPRRYLLPEGTYQNVYEQMKELKGLPMPE